MSNDFAQAYRNSNFQMEFPKFLGNVLGLYPADALNNEIRTAIRKYDGDDESVYRSVQERLPRIQSGLTGIRRAISALKKQRTVMVEQTLNLLGMRLSINTYLEVGTAGRYVPALRKQLVFSKAYLAADRRPGFTPTDILERGGLFRPWHFQNIGDYEPITGILEGEVDLVTIYIGIHHAPYKKLVTFLTSISQVIRKGGYLILREHDCDSPEMHQMAAMAHDVFNIATGVSWEENAREVRNFHSVSQFEILLSAYDFVKTEPGLLQEGDPTRNTLLVFRKQ